MRRTFFFFFKMHFPIVNEAEQSLKGTISKCQKGVEQGRRQEIEFTHQRNRSHRLFAQQTTDSLNKKGLPEKDLDYGTYIKEKWLL